VPKFAANLTMMFCEWAFLDRFAAAAEAGFEAVEFQFPYAFAADEIAARLGRHKLKVVMFNLPPGDLGKGDRGLAAIPERREEFRASVKLALNYARVLRVDRLHLMAGVADPSDPRARAAYLDALRYALDEFGSAAVVLIEPINRRDFPGYFLHDFDLAAQIIAEVGAPNLKLQFDIYHRQIMRGDVVEGLESLLPIIGHVQVASAPQRAEPGTGELNDAYIFDRLDALSYSGYVGCEYRPAAETLAGLAWFAAARSQ
jgi:hydroxypyruvate isomerase